MLDVFLFVYTVMTSTVVTAIGIILKDRYDTYIRSRTVENTGESVSERSIGDSWKAISLPPGEVIVETRNIVALLIKTLESDWYGVLLIGAPTGAGKSTYLSLAVKRYRTKNSINNNSIYYFDKFNIDLFSEIGMPKGSHPSIYFPQNTLIIIDQIDLKEEQLTPELKDFIVYLATNSRNFKTYRVFFWC